MIFGLALITWDWNVIGLIGIALSAILIWNGESAYEKRR